MDGRNAAMGSRGTISTGDGLEQNNKHQVINRMFISEQALHQKRAAQTTHIKKPRKLLQND